MRVEYHGKPSYAMAVCYLDYNESIRCESGAMATMSSSIKAGADTGPGGVVKGLIRRQLGSESFFMGRYTAAVQDAWVAVAPRLPGDIVDIDLAGDRPALIAESGSFLAMTDNVHVDVRWAGMKSIMLREGATMLRIHGDGKVLLCTFGGFIRHYLAPGQTVIVDTGHLVAYEETVSMRVGPLSGLITAGISGEGLVAQMTGPGAVWVQTRAETELKSWLFPERQQNQSRR